jgi:hypothetical protein
MSAKTADYSRRQIWLNFLRRHVGEMITPEMGIPELVEEEFWDEGQIKRASFIGLAHDFRKWMRDVKVDDEGNTVERVSVRTVDDEGNPTRGYVDKEDVEPVNAKIQVIEECWERGVRNLAEFVRLHDYYVASSPPREAHKIRRHFETRYRPAQMLLNLAPVEVGS